VQGKAPRRKAPHRAGRPPLQPRQAKYCGKKSKNVATQRDRRRIGRNAPGSAVVETTLHPGAAGGDLHLDWLGIGWI
jgi:hypothetical protein